MGLNVKPNKRIKSSEKMMRAAMKLPKSIYSTHSKLQNQFKLSADVTKIHRNKKHDEYETKK